MTRINSINRINKYGNLRANRIRQSYVNSLTTSSAVERVEPLDPANPGENHYGHSTENHLLSYESYYVYINELKEEFRNFYHRPQELAQTIYQVKENPQPLLERTKKLIQKYNQALEALALDNEGKTGPSSHVIKIQAILEQYRDQLEQLAIYSNSWGKLKLDEALFLLNIQQSHDPLKALFLPLKGIVLKLYSTLLAAKNSCNIKEKYNKCHPEEHMGLLLDKKT